MDNEITGKAKGGVARAFKLTPERRKEIAQKAALKRWDSNAMPEAFKEGLLPIGDIDLECYVLKDRRRLFHKRGMAKAIGLTSQGGNVFLRTMNRRGLGSVIPPELYQKLDNPIIFKPLSGEPAHGYEVTVLIEVCDAIWEAGKQDKLTASQDNLLKQAEIILRSSAKVGIIALVDEATGYIKDKRREEYRQLFQEFIRDEVRAWEKEFPDQFFDLIYNLYKQPRRHKNKHPQYFAHFIRKYVYAPLANSNGAILDILDEKNPTVYVSGGRKYKMHSFLTEQIGLQALRAHLWQLIGIGHATKTKAGFEKGFRRAFPQVGDQHELFYDDWDED